MYIANGPNFPDALAGAAAAGKDGAPLLLEPDPKALPPAIAAELTRLKPARSSSWAARARSATR